LENLPIKIEESNKKLEKQPEIQEIDPWQSAKRDWISQHPCPREEPDERKRGNHPNQNFETETKEIEKEWMDPPI